MAGELTKEVGHSVIVPKESQRPILLTQLHVAGHNACVPFHCMSTILS